MKILSLEVENFMAIGHIEAGLDERGLVLVEGENKDDSSQDSNGSGKSSFPDALSWCLFGSTARGETGDRIINRTAKKGTRVAVKLMDGDTKYQIARHRKHKGHKNRLIVLQWDDSDGSWVDITAGTDKLTQQIVGRIVGCSPQVFNAAIYAGQEAMPDLPGMTDKALKLLVEEAAGVDRLQAAHEKARARANEAAKSLESDINRRDLLESHMATCKEDMAQTLDDGKKFEESRKLRLAEIKGEYQEAAAQYKKANDYLSEHEAVCHEHELTELDAKLDSAEDHVEAAKEAGLDVSRKEAEISSAKRDFESAKKKLARLKEEYAAIGESVGRPCDSCGKPYEEADLADVKRLAKEKYDAMMDEAKAIKSRIESLSGELKELAAIEESAKQDVPDMSAIIERRDQLMNEENDCRNDLRNRQNAVDTFKRKAEEVKRRFDELRERENPTLKQMARLEKREKEIIEAMEKLAAKMEEAEADLEVKRMVVRLFSPAGVRAHILDTVTPFLNDRTSHYLTILSDGNIHAVWSTLTKKSDGDLSEKFQIAVESATGADSFGGLSGGEKRKVRLACAMALQDLVASRASKPIELFIADEIDQALDESGLERLMAILEDKASERGTVMAISHHSLRDWIRQSVVITKSGGKSTMSGAALAVAS